MVYNRLEALDNMLSMCMFHEVGLFSKVIPSNLRDSFLLISCNGCGLGVDVLP